MSEKEKFNRYTESTEDSTTHKLKTAFWTTKQVVITKFGRKEDEHVVASDWALDAKLELFRSIKRTCSDLSQIIDRYQDRICVLSQAENELGRFLKTRGGEDKTNAGKIMVAVGKSLSFSAQHRLALRIPLSRLQQEVDTFSCRAVSDTLLTVIKMEQSRTDYRAALLWMRDVSENLDPDTYKQLDKFRKVQAQVRKTKSKFEKVKLDSMQKVDLLAASRCNMFSNILGLYQTTLLQFWEKTCRTMVAVADSFQGYQYYEFSMLKHLTDDSLKLSNLNQFQEAKEVDLFQEESKDEVTDEDTLHNDRNHKVQNVLNNNDDNETDLLLMDEPKSSNKNDFKELNNCFNDLFTSDFNGDPDSAIKEAMEQNKVMSAKKEDIFGLCINDIDDQKKDNDFMDDFMSSDSSAKDFTTKQTEQQQPKNYDWEFLFGSNVTDPDPSLPSMPSTNSQLLSELMPSSLLDTCLKYNDNNFNVPLSTSSTTNKGYFPEHSQSKIDNKDNAAWLSMFADLDPLANPDSLSKKEGQITDT